MSGLRKKGCVTYFRLSVLCRTLASSEACASPDSLMDWRRAKDDGFHGSVNFLEQNAALKQNRNRSKTTFRDFRHHDDDPGNLRATASTNASTNVHCSATTYHTRLSCGKNLSVTSISKCGKSTKVSTVFLFRYKATVNRRV